MLRQVTTLSLSRNKGIISEQLCYLVDITALFNIHCCYYITINQPSLTYILKSNMAESMRWHQRLFLRVKRIFSQDYTNAALVDENNNRNGTGITSYNRGVGLPVGFKSFERRVPPRRRAAPRPPLEVDPVLLAQLDKLVGRRSTGGSDWLATSN